MFIFVLPLKEKKEKNFKSPSQKRIKIYILTHLKKQTSASPVLTIEVWHPFFLWFIVFSFLLVPDIKTSA